MENQFEISSLIESILDQVDDLIFILDPYLKIIFVNKNIEYLGYLKSETLDRFITDLLVEDENWERYLKEIEKEKELKGSLKFAHKNKACLKFDVFIKRLQDDSSRFEGFLIFAKKISKWEDLENHLLRVDRLVELGQIAAGIIHELKNPLAVIDQAVGWGKTLIKDKENLTHEDVEEVKHIFEEISKQTERCKSITNQILNFVREQAPEEKRVDIVKLIEDTLKYIEPETKYLPVKIEKEFPEEPVVILSDYNLLQQILVNLLINAVDAIKEKKGENHKLSIKVKISPTTIQIYISDTGPGISPDIQDKIFDLFFTTKPIGKGTGLGLAITKNIIEKLGGEISFETEKNKGTTFIITLPRNE